MTSADRADGQAGQAGGTSLVSSAVPPAPISWPTGFSAAACLTFDMDAESAILTGDISSIIRMTPMSHQSYGPLVGVPRILALLDRHGIKATFFVPGYSAHRYPQTEVEHGRLGLLIHADRVLVEVAVVGDLVARLGDAPHDLGISVCGVSGHEKRRLDVVPVQEREDPRHSHQRPVGLVAHRGHPADR